MNRPGKGRRVRSKELCPRSKWITPLATRLGAFAVESALNGAADVMVGDVGGTLTLTRLEQVWTEGKAIDPWMRNLARTLAT